MGARADSPSAWMGVPHLGTLLAPAVGLSAVVVTGSLALGLLALLIAAVLVWGARLAGLGDGPSAPHLLLPPTAWLVGAVVAGGSPLDVDASLFDAAGLGGLLVGLVLWGVVERRSSGAHARGAS